jgi:type III pantothenate kinase
MLLAIDVGNTNSVIGVFEGQQLRKIWRVSTHPAGTSDEFRAKLRSLFAMDGIRESDIASVVVSSVVPPYTGMLRTAFKGSDLHVIDSSWPFSFTIGASPATQVGADRLVNAEAVVRDFGAPAIVVDSGTATTVCAIALQDGRPCYLGGAIMPGIELSMEALAKNTAKLFAVELVAPARAIGTNTSEALRSGVLYGYAAMIDGMVRRFRAELEELATPAGSSAEGAAPAKIRVVATGGVSLLLQGIASELTDIDPDLTLKGIAYLHESLRRQ